MREVKSEGQAQEPLRSAARALVPGRGKPLPFGVLVLISAYPWALAVVAAVGDADCDGSRGARLGRAGSVSGKWQATRWPGASSLGSGTSLAHRSTARGQRVRNRQPDGGLIGDGGSPMQGRAGPRRARLGRGDRVEQRLRVRVQRLLVHRLAGADLAELAQVHHRDPVADLLDQGQVVGDEQVGQAQLAAQPLEEVEHLRLDQHVQGGDRLVADEQRRLKGDGARDGDPLRLAAGQLARVALGVPGRVEADQVEQLVDALAAGGAAAGVVGDQRFLDDGPHLPLGVEGAERVLEHELQVLAAPAAARRRAAWSGRCRGTRRSPIWAAGPGARRGRGWTCPIRSRRRCRASRRA